jgi:hypothetical protein
VIRLAFVETAFEGSPNPLWFGDPSFLVPVLLLPAMLQDIQAVEFLGMLTTKGKQLPCLPGREHSRRDGPSIECGSRSVSRDSAKARRKKRSTSFTSSYDRFHAPFELSIRMATKRKARRKSRLDTQAAIANRTGLSISSCLRGIP